VLQAALEEFGEKGYPGTTTAGIARAAGVSEKTVFDLFGDKKSLYLEVRAAVTDEIMMDILPRLPLGAGAPDILRALGREFLEQTLPRLSRIRVSIQAISALEDPDIRRDARGFFIRLHDMIEKMLEDGRHAGLVREDVDLDQFAWAYVLALHSIGYLELVDRGRRIDTGRAMGLIDGIVDLVEVR